MYLIVGLGNPGRRYEKTKHNVGFDAIDSLAQYFDVKVEKSRFKGVYAEARYKENKLILLKPETYMNASGDCVSQFVSYYNIDIENVIVLVDDIDIKFGTVRIKKNGSAGTHNGLKSIIQRFGGNKNFPRVKISVGKKPEYMDLGDFVLSKFTTSERFIVDKEILNARDGVLEIIDNGIDKAMNLINSRDEA